MEGFKSFGLGRAFFTENMEPKTFIPVSAPIPIIVGGFVGSKSQMHCGKPNSDWLMEFVCQALNTVSAKPEQKKEKVTPFMRMFKKPPSSSQDYKEYTKLGNSMVDSEELLHCSIQSNLSNLVQVTQLFNDVVTQNLASEFCQVSEAGNKKHPEAVEESSSAFWVDASKFCEPINVQENCVSPVSQARQESPPKPYFPEPVVDLSELRSPSMPKVRFSSECSLDSSESCDSFIMFEEQWDIADFDEDDDAASSDDDFDVCFVEDPLRLDEVNSKWNATYGDVAIEEKSDAHREVKFTDKVTVHKMIAWEYAYRQARLGPWEQIARDRARFRDRIARVEAVLARVLNPAHRKKMFRRYHS